MASITDIAGNEAALTRQAAILASPAAPERHMANAIRALAIDAVEAAKCGHPGMPMGMADVATVLWTKFLKYDAADPKWPDRDRFILSAGHGSMLLYALLHLTGHDGMAISDLKNFRQLHSAAPWARASPPPSAWPSPSACSRKNSAKAWSTTGPGSSPAMAA
jgi:transketolase